MGLELRKFRLKRGLTQERLAELAGVEQSYISDLELTADPNVGWHVLRRLKNALGVRPERIFPDEPRTHEERV